MSNQPKNKRLSQTDRETLFALARKKIHETEDRAALDVAYEAAAEVIYRKVQEKYAPADMAILKRYGAALVDNCIYYSTGGSNYEQFQFRRDDGRAPLVPYSRGCNSRTPYLLEGQDEAALKAFRAADGAHRGAVKQRERDFKSLIWGAKSFNEVVGVWPGAETLRETIVGTGTALAVLSSEVIDRLRTDQALAA